MIPILFDGTETDFAETSGLYLNDMISCKVTEERNGAYTATCVISTDDMWFSQIEEGKIILAKPNETDDPQPFRIYRIVRKLDKKATLYCEHVKEILKGIPVRPDDWINNQAKSPGDAWGTLQRLKLEDNPFSFTTDITTTAMYYVNEPTTFASRMVGSEGSMLQTYGGEFKYDKFSIQLLSDRGEDNGVSITYGKNLTGITQDIDTTKTYSGVFPYWKGTDDAGSDVTICIGYENYDYTAMVIYAGNYQTFPYQKILPLDLSQKFEKMPTSAQMRLAADSYISENKINVPDISIKVSFVPLWQALGYEELIQWESVSLCDTIHVVVPFLQIEAEAKVVKTVYDTLKERYESIDVGTIKKKLTTSVNADITTLNKRLEVISKKQTQVSRKTIAASADTVYKVKGGRAHEITITGSSDAATGKYIVYDGVVTAIKSGSNLSVTAAHPTGDTVNWEITVENNDTSGISVYITEIYS